jgi:hypothetical protein
MNTTTAPIAYSNGVDTSNAAAASIEPHLPRLEQMVYDCIKGWGDDGLTCDSVELMTALPHQTASARIKSLVDRGVIKDTGLRRQTRSGRMARVYACM